MRAIYVPLEDHALQQLGRLARRERRHPKDTAALLLERALEEVERTEGASATPSERDDRDVA
jgi:hypothetical protein